MIANNFFRALGDFHTNFLFKPYDMFRAIEGWWESNVINEVFIFIGFVLFLYWLGQLQRFRKTSTE